MSVHFNLLLLSYALNLEMKGIHMFPQQFSGKGILTFPLKVIIWRSEDALRCPRCALAEPMRTFHKSAVTTSKRDGWYLTPESLPPLILEFSLSMASLLITNTFVTIFE